MNSGKTAGKTARGHAEKPGDLQRAFMRLGRRGACLLKKVESPLHHAGALLSSTLIFRGQSFSNRVVSFPAGQE